MLPFARSSLFCECGPAAPLTPYCPEPCIGFSRTPINPAQSPDFRGRLTEKRGIACDRLRAALYRSPIKNETRCCSFQDGVDWLTECDNLFLVLDPFGCHDADETKRQEWVQMGHIDVGILDSLITRCLGHQRCIVQLWTSTARTLGTTLEPTVASFKKWHERGCSVRQFHDRSNHHCFIVGIGDGCEIVNALPGNEDWGSSWVKGTVTRQRAPRLRAIYETPVQA